MFLHLMERTGNWSIFYGMRFWILHEDYDGDGDDNMKVMVMMMVCVCMLCVGGSFSQIYRSWRVLHYARMQELWTEALITNNSVGTDQMA